MLLDFPVIVCDNSVVTKKGRRSTNEERLRAVQLLENGYSAEAVADIFEVGRSSVLSWQAMYRAGGLAALLTKFASGRPTALSDQRMMQLSSLLVGRDPRQHSFGVALWTRKLIALYRAYQQNPERVTGDLSDDQNCGDKGRCYHLLR